MEIVSNILDFIFPKTSIISGKRLDENVSNLYMPEEEIFSLNRISLKDHEDLSLKLNSEYSFSCFAFYEGDDFSKIIYQLKYGGMKKLGIFLGELLGRELKKYADDKNFPGFDYIIPVPLFRTKLRERGYNQSGFICRGMCNVLGIEFSDNIVKRIKQTKTQTRLNREERIDNVKSAFVINEKYSDKISGKRVIIVDDVITTGSTINEVIKVIKQYSKSEVMGCTLAMARD